MRKAGNKLPALPLNILPRKTSYALTLLLCCTLAGAGGAIAQDTHDHGAGHKTDSAIDLADMHGHGSHQNHAVSATPVTEVLLPDELSSAHSMVMDSAGRLWFAEKIGKKLAMYDPEKKAFATHALPSSWGETGLSSITLAPDGDIWFTVTRWVEGSKEPHIIGRFSPADGYFTKYAIPHNAVPEELMVDTNGTVWFIAANKNYLYRVDSKTFALKGYPLPTADGGPKGLAADQKGHIWFVESIANKLVQFIPEQGVFHEYELLTQFANPGKVSVDKQGRIWFVEMTANRIGMFSPELKRFNEAIIPTPSSAPVALANDDDGNIWFLEYKGNKVGVFNSEKATFREYDIPSYGSLPSDIVIDRKRSMIWFTQSSTDAKRLGMIHINEALSESYKQETSPQSPSAKDSSGTGMTAWLVFLAALAGIAVLGLGLNKKLQGRKKTGTQG